jgi:hypothetical protein
MNAPAVAWCHQRRGWRGDLELMPHRGHPCVYCGDRVAPFEDYRSGDVVREVLLEISEAIGRGIQAVGGFTESPAYRALDIARCTLEAIPAGDHPESVAINRAEHHIRGTA